MITFSISFPFNPWFCFMISLEGRIQEVFRYGGGGELFKTFLGGEKGSQPTLNAPSFFHKSNLG